MGRSYITKKMVDEITKLWREGNSQRSISRNMGISRGVVTKVICGELKPCDISEKPPERETVELIRPKTNGRKARCPECGGLVYPPCYACQIRKIGKER